MRDDSFLFFNMNLHTDWGDKATRVGFMKVGEEKVINLVAYKNFITAVLAAI
jgi:hypothetical protein